ncbi:MAG TPA: tRNA lysidine(34) synthetase TilS, partial [Actinobacteria bacterium]|nr:tRNA lysidine(34) synthetase TilS [Actinomycetota bacterium]
MAGSGPCLAKSRDPPNDCRDRGPAALARSRRLSELADLVIGAAAAALGDRPGDDRPLIVATSGGADSASALWACAQIADVTALHVDHGWPYSQVLAGAADAVAGQVGVPLIEEQIEVGPSESSARSGRYRVFERHVGDGLIVTGHTADDLAETVLANLARGAGLHGQQGIPFERPGVIRPFLAIRRDQLRELAALLGLRAIDDRANFDPSYTGVRLRSMLRGWEEAAGREIVPAIARGARLAAEESKFVDERSLSIEVRTDGSVVAIDIPRLVTAP